MFAERTNLDWTLELHFPDVSVLYYCSQQQLCRMGFSPTFTPSLILLWSSIGKPIKKGSSLFHFSTSFQPGPSLFKQGQLSNCATGWGKVLQWKFQGCLPLRLVNEL